jgi:parvulin-like peptidyl-prolyl isomerase
MREFIQLSYPLILTELITVVDSELLLTEAERNLTEQERRGLLYWLSAEREKQVRSAGGTRAGLENKLLSEGGITIEEHMDVLRKQVLGSEHLRKEIGPRIVVSWRDIERYYESHPEEFNSHETVELRIIKVNEANRNRIPLIQQALDEGEPFENVARQYSDLLASGGGLLRENPVAQATNIPEVNAVVSQLKEHEFTGPIETAGGTYWVYMENHNAPRSVSLYDAQRDIQKKLFDQMARQEEINYKLKLRQRADYDENDVEYMTTALLAVATSRWGPRE